MPKVYALLVGIDFYLAPKLDLQGCVNDVRLAERLLRERVAPADLAVETLCDEQATRAAIVGRFRRHLGAAGPGDIALFWFSGHGSTGDLPEKLPYARTAGVCQTTLCHDSRAGAADLYDKELAVLAGEVLAGGAQLVTIMDSCHSRSAMRGDPPTGLRPRVAPARAIPPELHELLPELVTAAAGPIGMQQPGHVALSACNEWQLANEDTFDDGVHGVFSEALSNALARLDRDATYRQVLSYARCRVEGRFRAQRPDLETAGPLADVEFLRGALRPRAAHITLRSPADAWEIDAGSVHGIAEDSRLGVHGEEPLREVRVTEVQVERSLVEPIGWAPDPDQQYDMVVTDVPLPPVAVVIQARPEVVARLRAEVRVAGPGGQPSPHIRVVETADLPAAPLLLRVRATGSDLVEVTSADHEPLAPANRTDHDGLVRTVLDLEHIARWMQVRNLTNPSLALENAVRIEIVPAGAGRPLPPGNLELAYTWTGREWKAPEVFIRLRNTTGKRLYCVLLDLTDRHRIHADLFPGEYVDRHWTADVGYGAPIAMSLPPDQTLEPGASVTDWLMLLVAEEPFNSEPFALPRLRATARGPARGTDRIGLNGVLDRLGLLATRRDAAPAPRVARDWAVTVVELKTLLPGKIDAGARGR